jgi:hypothetical protein
MKKQKRKKNHHITIMWFLSKALTRARVYDMKSVDEI